MNYTPKQSVVNVLHYPEEFVSGLCQILRMFMTSYYIREYHFMFLKKGVIRTSAMIINNPLIGCDQG